MSICTHLGVSKVSITPEFPAELQPYHPKLRAEGKTNKVNRPIHVRTFVFKQRDEAGRETFGLIVSADIIYFVDQRVASLRKQLFDKYGIEGKAVLFQGTHTHSAPYPGCRESAEGDGPYREYIELLESRVMESVRQAMANLEPVEMEKGRGTCDIGVYRRRFENGRYPMRPDPDGPTDPELNVFRFRKEEGGTKAIVVNFACHPTTTCNNAVSSDFPGAAMDELEDRLGGGAVSMFLQGCCGDIKVAAIRNDNFYDGGEEDIAKFGHELAEQTMTVLEQPMQPRPFVPFQFRHKRVQLPFQTMPSMEELHSASKEDNIRKEWARILMTYPELLRESDPFEIHYYEFGDGFSIIAMNGEVVGEYGRYMKKRFGDQVLPMGYSNGHTTYIPTAQQLAEGGYEGHYVFFRHGKPSPYHPSIESIIKDGMVELIGR